MNTLLKYISEKKRLPAGLLLGLLSFLMLALPFGAYAQTAQGGSTATSAAGGAAACAATLIINELLGYGVGGATAAGTGGTTANAVLSVPVSDVPLTVVSTANAVSNATDLALHTGDNARDNILSCLARAVARAMLQQITISTVNWINSGFSGSPSFISNYQQFFTNVADQAAGSFIQGSDLAFLCSPFRLQVRIAVAQAYLRYAPSCTLTDVTSNIQGFMNDFTQGGWPAYLSFTTAPMNNPYGAFMYAQAGVQSAVANAQGTKRFDATLGSGFLSTQKEQNCNNVQLSPEAPPPSTEGGKKSVTVTGGGGNEETNQVVSYRVCNLVNVTPGTTVSQTLDKALGANTQSLISAKTWDESISAIVSALITQVLYTGLSALSNSGSGYQSNFSTTISSLSSQAGQDLAGQIENAKTAPQAIIAAEQQNIPNVQSAKIAVQGLKQCWLTATSSDKVMAGHLPFTAEQIALAGQNVSNQDPILQSLDSRLTAYQAMLQIAETSIVTLAQYITQAQNTTSLTAIQNLTSSFTSYSLSQQLPNASDLIAVQQDQAQLQTYLATVNQNVQTGLTQCHAFEPPLSPTSAPNG